MAEGFRFRVDQGEASARSNFRQLAPWLHTAASHGHVRLPLDNGVLERDGNLINIIAPDKTGMCMNELEFLSLMWRRIAAAPMQFLRGTTQYHIELCASMPCCGKNLPGLWMRVVKDGHIAMCHNLTAGYVPSTERVHPALLDAAQIMRDLLGVMQETRVASVCISLIPDTDSGE